MRRMLSRKARQTLVLVMGAALLAAGCTNTEANPQPSADAIPSGPFAYPMSGGVELRMMNETLGTTPERLPIDDEYELRTGIKIKHLGGTPMTDPKFSLMLASGELPDIFMNTWLQYPGGPERAVEQGYILKLNDTRRI
jgi:putative aldouronate transport system substrate-binding protein